MGFNCGLDGVGSALAVVVLSTVASAQNSGATLPQFVEDRVVLVLSESVPNFGDDFDLAAMRAAADPELRDALDRFGAWRVYPVCRSGGEPIRDAQAFRALGLDRHFVVDLARGTNEELALAAFTTCRSVESARLDGIMQGGGQVTPNDPLFAQQWNLSQANDHDIDADFAWDITKGSPQIIVAVLDTGIDLTHPDLVGGVWINHAEIPGNALDDDGNGQIDDVHGYNFDGDDANVQDDNGHGTACAGIIGARGFNNQGVAGIAWHCTILPVRVLHDDDGTPGGASSGSWTDLAAGIRYSADQGAHVISMSIWDSSNSGSDVGVSNALAYAAGLDVLCVAITGNANQGWVSFPASDANCMAVGATTRCDSRKEATAQGMCSDDTSWGSNWDPSPLVSPQIDLVAPGETIATTWLSGQFNLAFDGTSAAAPHVAGVAALIRSLDPSLSAAEVKAILTSSAAEDQVGPVNSLGVLEDTPGFDAFFGHGRLNAYRALLAVVERGTTSRVSVDSSGNQGNSDSFHYVRSISSDGRYVAFSSYANNLVAGDTNGVVDDFVRDRQTGQTTRVSVDSSGNQGNNESQVPSISSDGRCVAFHSFADNLVAGDSNGVLDVFVRDRQTGQTTRVSVDSSGNQGNGVSLYPSISSDGRYVAFHSYASNLVAGDTNGLRDVFVHDRQTGQTKRVSIDSSGSEGNNDSFTPSICADGRYVAFYSSATNLVAGDTNGVLDVFVHDRQTAQTTRVSVDSSGNQANSGSSEPLPSISSDGRYVAFDSDASNLVASDTNGVGDVFVHDRQTAQTTRASVNSSGNQGNNWSDSPSISADGRYVAFRSSAGNLVAGDTNGFGDAFVRDRQTGQTTRVSVSSSGNQGIGVSHAPSISSDGRHVEFYSNASNLVVGDTNGIYDVFVHDREVSSAARYCSGKLSSVGCMPSITWFGEASATSSTAFDIGASNVVSAKSGLFFFGLNGPSAAPFQGGTLCVTPPTVRTPIQSSGGTPGGGDCTGTYSRNFNAAIQGGAYSGLAIGVSVCGQYWQRDPASPSTTGLTDGIAFTVQP